VTDPERIHLSLAKNQNVPVTLTWEHIHAFKTESNIGFFQKLPFFKKKISSTRIIDNGYFLNFNFMYE
jgi:hypothetical protein